MMRAVHYADLCYIEDKDIVQMLIRCPALSEVRIADFIGLPYFS